MNAEFVETVYFYHVTISIQNCILYNLGIGLYQAMAYLHVAEFTA